MKNVKVLIIEDNPLDAHLFKKGLEERRDINFVISHAETLREAKEHLRRETFDVMVVDLGLPDSQGLETFIEIQNSAPAVATIVLSGSENESWATQAVRLGAQDYLLKDRCDAEIIRRCINYAIERHIVLTELKQANESIRRAWEELGDKDEHLQRILGVVTDGFWDWDTRTGSVKREAGWPKILGYRLEEIQPTLNAWEQLIHPDDSPRILESINGCLAGKADKYEHEYRMKAKSGEWKWIRDLGQIVERDENGKALRVVGALRDITEQKQAEIKNRESQRRLELALEGADLGWWEWNPQDDKNFTDERSTQILGYSPIEVTSLNKSWDALAHPDDKPNALESLNKCLRGEIASYDSEHRVRTKKGEWKWVLVRGKVVERDAEGKPIRMAGTYLDITDRKLAEQALRQSEHRFRTIFEGAEDPIFIKDRSLKYVQVNPAFEKLAGLPPSQIIGKRHEDVFGGETSKFIRDMDLRALSGETVEDEHGKTIQEVPMRFLATRVPLREASGEIVGILIMLHDITDRKRIDVSPERTAGSYPSKIMRATLHQADLVAKRSSTVLLTGESGSGKDYLAKYIHHHSDRATGPYFSINCAAIAPELAESELFGHEKGSFTGAVGRKRGMLELAEGGTLLLNEIGDLSLPLQAKLLTFLDTRKFTRVGGEKEISVSARLIAATNRDLEEAVERGGFRKDLFYRLNVMTIPVPPLRERLDDIPVLVQEMLANIRDEMQIHEMPAIGPGAIDAMKKYSWPGNVRELRNVLERVIILSHGEEITPSVLGLSKSETPVPLSETRSFCASFPSDRSLNEITKELKRFMVNEALRQSGGSRQEAAKLLGISRYSLKHYMSKLGYAEEEE